MELKTFKIVNDEPFKMYLLSDINVKRLVREFEFYNIRIYREERTKVLTVCIDYPKNNVYWFVEFKRFIINEIVIKDGVYGVAWNKLLDDLKKEITLDYQKALNDLKSITEKDVVLTMNKYGLRDYQAFDLLQLQFKLHSSKPHTGLILSEQRTGKTRVALASAKMNLIPGSVVLIVCPKSAQDGWKNEINELSRITKETDAVDVISKTTNIKEAHDKFDINCINFRIITYDLLKRLTKLQIKTLLNFTDANEIMIIGDEVHRLRNFKTQQSEALLMVKDMCKDKELFVLGLTGTPSVKDTYDIFGILSFINFSKIGFHPTSKDFNQFKEYFYNCEDTSYGKVCKSLKKRAELKYLIQLKSVQTKQSDLELFKNYTKKYFKVNLKMDDFQDTIYKDVAEKFEYSTDIDCKNTLVKYTRLQQVCNDPSILVENYDNVSPKLKYITHFALKNKKQFIVMSKQVKVLKNLEIQLSKNKITYSKLYGNMSLSERIDNVDLFKNGSSQILIAQLDVAREALTLPEAAYTIFLDRDFAQGYNEQAEARMTPIDGKPHTKYIIDLVMEGTIEEIIYELLVVRKENIEDINVVFKGG